MHAGNGSLLHEITFLRIESKDACAYGNDHTVWMRCVHVPLATSQLLGSLYCPNAFTVVKMDLIFRQLEVIVPWRRRRSCALLQELRRLLDL